ncbi:MAG: S8 family serine peptidase [Clostridia bacterium]|nr:S8 family serine peptidase [Clostridia bacterium]
MKKYLKLTLSFMVMLSVIITPNGALVKSATVAPKATATISETKTEPETKTQSVVTVNSSNAQTLCDKTEPFYEPKAESITPVSQKLAYINDAVTVFFNDGATDEEKQAVIGSVGGEIVGEAEFMNQYEIKIQHSELEEITALCDNLMENESVEFATCTTMTDVEPQSIPDDPWNGTPDWSDKSLNRSYSSSNWWIKAIDADKAWDYQDKMSHIKIGIVDSGFDIEHEDLQGKITFPTKFFAKHNMPDDHGTHVAGIIAANQNNGIGITGIVDDCELVCVDWHAQKEQGQHWISDLRIMSGFISVVRAGAKVVNFSLGSSSDIPNGTTDRYKIIKDIEAKYTSYIMAKLLQAGYDFICCQSAGNGVDMKDGSSFAVDASNNGNFCTITKENAVKFVIGVKPQDILDRIIVVASAAFDGYGKYKQSYFSNGGEQVSICAPGSRIYSLTYDEETEYSDYSYKSGTSMAAPVVTGVTALVWSINPDLTGAQVKHFVCDIENTKIMVADSDDETHLPVGEIPMVNAQLAVEAALRAIDDPDILAKDAENQPADPEQLPAEIETTSTQTEELKNATPAPQAEKKDIRKALNGIKRIGNLFTVQWKK